MPTPEALLSLARAFQESRVLLTGAELNLFTPLSTEALTADALAARVGADPRALATELDALAAMDLLVKADGKYRTAPEAACLSEDAPDSILPMLLHAAALWDRWTGLTRRVGGTPLSERPAAAATRAFIEAMHVVSAPQAARLARDVGLGDARRLLDVGGGPGTYTAAFLREAPGLSATLFDLPPVVEIARERLSRAGLLGRVTLVAGDFETDELPGGHDLAWLSAIVHQNGPAQNDALYARILRALAPGGRLVIRDHLMEPDRTRPRAGALFAVNMLVGTAARGHVHVRRDPLRPRARRLREDPYPREGERMDGLVEAFRP